MGTAVSIDSNSNAVQNCQGIVPSDSHATKKIVMISANNSENHLPQNDFRKSESPKPKDDNDGSDKKIQPKPSNIPKRSFHQRVLPPSCIAFSSSEGRQRLKESLNAGTAETFFPLSENFRTQDDPTYCGISTLVMCLNALSIDPERVWKGIWRWFAEDMLECCISLEEVREKGTTLEQIAHLARCNGAKTPISGGKSHGILRGNELTVETLRSIVREICRLGPWCKRINNYENCQGGDKNCIGPCDGADFCDQDSKQPGIIIVSYSRKTLGQTGDGHFSPVAAFHEPSDSCLIMDVARFKYPPYWISIQTLYDAIQPIDSTTKKPRGIILLCQGGGIWEPKVCQDSDFKVEQEEYDCKICPVPRPL
mmetsp:Transcript_5084/g.7018  ORF Transcript_5084/g.7018 Transcript_5084/m.7018 type:complete len:367 (+) Transcript_5084:62-1162(+)